MKVRLFFMFMAGMNFEMLVNCCAGRVPVWGWVTVSAGMVGLLCNFTLAWKWDWFFKPNGRDAKDTRD